MTIELQFDDRVTRELLNAVVTNLTHTQRKLLSIGRMIVSGVQENFEIGGAYSSADNVVGGSKKWQPLSSTTKKIKERRGKKGPYQILVDSAMLRDSITARADKDSVVVGTNVEYAATQHFGAKKGEFGIFDALVKAHVRNLTREGQSIGKSGKPGKVKKMSLKSSVRGYIRKQPVPFGDIPARPFMTIHPDLLTEIDQTLIDFILTGK